MALACKANVWPVAGFVALAAVLDWSRNARTRNLPELAFLKLALVACWPCWCFVSSALRFPRPNIWNVSLEPRWLANMSQVQSLMSGAADQPPGHQWTDRTPIIFPWTNMVVWGLGLPLGLPRGSGGRGWPGRLVRRKQWRDHLLPCCGRTVFFIYQGTQWSNLCGTFCPCTRFSSCLQHIGWPILDCRLRIVDCGLESSRFNPMSLRGAPERRRSNLNLQV